MITLEKYLLQSLADLDEFTNKIGHEKFYPYQDRVFQILSKMHPGNTYNIIENIRSENREIFVKCVCVYMRRMKGDCNVQFTDDYTSIKGIESFNQERKSMQEYQDRVKRMKQGNRYEKSE
jgi:hypothetical protein